MVALYSPELRVAICSVLVLALGCIGPVGPLGYLEGTVSIGPLRPVESADRPPAVPPELCRAQEFRVLAEDDGTERLRFKAGPDCTFRVELPPGRYRLEYAGSRDLPRVIEIGAGETTRIEVHIDTGIR